MALHKHPLELVLRAHGTAELINSDEEILWVSDSDDDFKEEFSNEFLNEEDIPGILDYLREQKVLTQMEYNALNSDRWDCTIETLDSATVGSEDDEEDEDFEEDDEDD
jgi:predicted dithiol-disulfide oxidoreductase (DUF899 family)